MHPLHCASRVPSCISTHTGGCSEGSFDIRSINDIVVSAFGALRSILRAKRLQIYHPSSRIGIGAVAAECTQQLDCSIQTQSSLIAFGPYTAVLCGRMTFLIVFSSQTYNLEFSSLQGNSPLIPFAFGTLNPLSLNIDPGYPQQQQQQGYGQGYGGQPQQGYYPPPPQQAYGGQPQQGYYPQPQPQPVYVQQPQKKGGGGGGTACCACCAGMLACCCLEDLCLGMYTFAWHELYFLRCKQMLIHLSFLSPLMPLCSLYCADCMF